MEVIDLSVALGPDLPCWWPGLAPYSTTDSLTLERDGVFSRAVTIEEHTGTHADAPTHIAAGTGGPVGELSIDQLPLASFSGRVRILDARTIRGDVPGTSPWVPVELVDRFEKLDGRLEPGDAFLLRTGWSDQYYEPFPAGRAYVQDALDGVAPGWPCLPPQVIARLAERRVSVIGVDTPSLGAVQDALEPHRAALGAGIRVVENLTGLGAIRGEATFLFLPLAIRGGSGAPGRAVALQR